MGEKDYLLQLIEAYDALAVPRGYASAGSYERIRTMPEHRLKGFCLSLEHYITSMGGEPPKEKALRSGPAPVLSISEQLVLTEEQVDNLLEQVKAAFKGLRDSESSSHVFFELGYNK